MSFHYKLHEAYIPLNHSLEEDALVAKQLDQDKVLAKLKPILENPKIGKIGQNIKYDAHVLRRYGIDLNITPSNWKMDTMLATMC